MKQRTTIVNCVAATSLWVAMDKDKKTQNGTSVDATRKKTHKAFLPREVIISKSEILDFLSLNLYREGRKGDKLWKENRNCGAGITTVKKERLKEKRISFFSFYGLVPNLVITKDGT